MSEVRIPALVPS